MKTLKYHRYITLPNILWYITGQFILEFILDFNHNIQGKEPFWNDAESCGKYFCRYCGGEFYKKIKKEIITTFEDTETYSTEVNIIKNK